MTKTMKDDALARDLAKMQERAYHMGEWTEPVVQRYHALALAGTHPDAAAVRAFYAWLFVPPTLWPFNVLDVLAGCLDVLAAGERPLASAWMNAWKVRKNSPAPWLLGNKAATRRPAASTGALLLPTPASNSSTSTPLSYPEEALVRL